MEWERRRLAADAAARKLDDSLRSVYREPRLAREAIEQDARTRGWPKLRESLSSEPRRFGKTKAFDSAGPARQAASDLAERVEACFVARHEYLTFSATLFAAGRGSGRDDPEAVAQAEELRWFTEHWPMLDRMAPGSAGGAADGHDPAIDGRSANSDIAVESAPQPSIPRDVESEMER